MKLRRILDYFANKENYPTEAYPKMICRVTGHNFDEFNVCKRCGMSQTEAIRMYLLQKHFVKK